MKKLTPIVVLLLLSLSGFAQKVGKDRPDFDIDDFNKKFEVAQWLVEYDNVAWKTTDEVVKQDKKDLEKLGAEWFCFKDKKNVWHAIYGKLGGETGYQAVFHFEMDASGKITRSAAKLDQSFLDGHARALATASTKLKQSIPENSPKFNQYIKQNDDKTYSVWLFPAFQTNGLAVYGGEAIYTIDRVGLKITKDESYFQPNFRGFKSEPPREIWLNYTEMKKPSLGAIFFVWYYKPYFTKIIIDNENSTSTAIKSDQGYLWAHIEKKAVPDSSKTN